MQKIIEMNLEEIAAVTGGHKTVSASASISTSTAWVSVSWAQPTLSTSIQRPTFAAPTQTLQAYRL